MSDEAEQNKDLFEQLKNLDLNTLSHDELERWKTRVNETRNDALIKDLNTRIDVWNYLHLQDKEIKKLDHSDGNKDKNKDKDKDELTDDDAKAYYGVDHEVSPEQLAQNMAALDKMPSVENIIPSDGTKTEFTTETFEKIQCTLKDLKITDEDGKPVETAEEDRKLFLEMVYLETKLAMSQSQETPTYESFMQEYADRLNTNLIFLGAFARGLDVNTKDPKKLQQQLEFKPFEIKKEDLGKWMSFRMHDLELAHKQQLSQHTDAPVGLSALGKLTDSIKTLDGNFAEKYGKCYQLTKRLGRTALIAAVPPLAFAAAGQQMYNLYKDFKTQKKENPKLTAKSYFKNPKNALALAGVALTLGGLGGWAGVSKAVTGGVVAAAGGLYKAQQAYKQAPEGQKWKATLTTFAGSAALFGASYLIGHEVGSAAHGWWNDHMASTGHTEEQPPADQNVEAEQPSEGQEIDLNNLTPKQEHDLKMLVLRDPAEANQLLGRDGAAWMNSSKLQAAWDNGDITDDDKVKLVNFGGQRFDEHGNFRDFDGLPSAAKMEADAASYEHAHHSSTKASEDIKPDDGHNQPADHGIQTETAVQTEQTGGDANGKVDAAAGNATAEKTENTVVDTPTTVKDVSFNYARESDGSVVKMTLDSDGHTLSGSVTHKGGTTTAFSDNQLKQMNENSHFVEYQKNNFQDLINKDSEGYHPVSKLDMSRVSDVTTHTAPVSGGTQTPSSTVDHGTPTVAIEQTGHTDVGDKTVVTPKAVPSVPPVSADLNGNSSSLAALMASKLGRSM